LDAVFPLKGVNIARCFTVILLNECLTHYYEETFAGYGTLTLPQTQDRNVIKYAISREIKAIIAAPAG
jgi:hypothetical protein